MGCGRTVGIVSPLLRGEQDEKPYCLTGECSRDVKRCLTKCAPVASFDPPAEPQLLFRFLNQCLLMLALWSCGRRVSVVQAQRQIHRALRAAFTAAKTVGRTIAEQPARAVPRGHTSIGRHGSEYHSAAQAAEEADATAPRHDH